MPEINHANQIRGSEFKRLLKKRLFLILVPGVAVVLGVALAAAGLAAIGLLGFVLTILIGLGVTFAIADNKAETAFFKAYADSRGLTVGKDEVGGLTPLLRKGDDRKIDRSFTGPLDDGFDGTLALYTYTVESRDSDGNTSESSYPFTLVLINLPETVEPIAELLLQRKSGLKALEKFEDAFRRKHERVTLESEAMRDRYEIFVLKVQDAIWVRRLFSPSFIVWLTETPPPKFAFELVEGNLCAYVPGHRDSTDGFNEMIAVSSAVARRLRDEAVG